MRVDLVKVHSIIEPHASVFCDENHCHSYNCLRFYDPVYDLMEQMRIEIIELRAKLSEIEKITKGGNND